MPDTLRYADPNLHPNQGEGISRRTSRKGTKLWVVLVTFPHGARPLKDSIRAKTLKEALQFAKNRYPAAVTVKALSKTGQP